MGSEARTSPEIEALELKLAAGEDQANLGTVMKKVKVELVWKILRHCKQTRENCKSFPENESNITKYFRK